MRFQQLREIIEYLIQSRDAMGQLYLRLASQAQDPRAAMLLNYMVDKEGEIIEHLQDYLQQAPQGVLDTWFENVAESHLLEECKASKLEPGMTDEQVLALALTLDNQVLQLLQGALAASPTPDVEAAVNSLVVSERHRQQRFTHSTLRLHDL